MGFPPMLHLSAAFVTSSALHASIMRRRRNAGLFGGSAGSEDQLEETQESKEKENEKRRLLEFNREKRMDENVETVKLMALLVISAFFVPLAIVAGIILFNWGKV